jgi:DNA-3-methyladenine glycosylase I
MPSASAEQSRCAWPGDDPLYVAYHDDEWGVPEHDDRALFEKLVLDGFQAGLSWITILRKRENFRAAFKGFEPNRIARFGDKDVARLMADAGIVRNRAKIEGAVASAKAYLSLHDSGQTFDQFLWQFTDGRTCHNRWRSMKDIPPESAESLAMSKALKAAGFKFCGPTICYAFMQAVGMISDHVVGCFRYKQLSE